MDKKIKIVIIILILNINIMNITGLEFNYVDVKYDNINKLKILSTSHFELEFPSKVIFDERLSRSDSRENEYMFSFYYDNEKHLRESSPELLTEPVKKLLNTNDDIIESEFLSLFEDNGRPILIVNDTEEIIEESFLDIEYDNKVVGEQVFKASASSLLAPNVYSFYAAIILDDGILNIDLSFYDADCKIPEYFKQYFVKREETFYWVNLEARSLFYEQLRNNNIPKELRVLQESWDEIINSFKFKSNLNNK